MTILWVNMRKNMETCNECGREVNLPASYRGKCSACKNGKTRYGMNAKQQIDLLEYQDNKCGICKKDIKLFEKGGGVVDHYGKSGVSKIHWEEDWFVRGILCSSCNTDLSSNGLTWLRNAIEYLTNPPALSLKDGL